MDLHLKIANLRLQLFPKRRSLVEIALAEGLDEFAELESVKEGTVEYWTMHGYRRRSCDRPKHNIFFVVEDRAGFARANDIPYELHYSWELLTYEEIAQAHQSLESADVPMLIVNFVSPNEPAAEAGWAKAVELPYYLQYDDFFKKSILIIGHTLESEATAAGYARAVPIPAQSDNVYVEHLKMLNTPYPASLVDFPYFR
ncbi:hypothetical protein [Aliterella atlantica]|uniref:Uncharacterized protein n=1 Tax=Aliterella atlantica CENA595 TaxID=1618023 RepID=A0A0D8ZMS4_9CYAN|nr:hypothetical protein [Aliterella atlantica]KJH70055.1 hypothetical protein UH38_20080 [Aliterella atlantica CENA595]